MADHVDPAIAEADRAAEALAAQSRESLKPDVDPAREAALDEAFAQASKKEAPRTGLDSPEFGRENGGVRRPIEGAPTPEETQRAEDEAAAEEARKQAEAEAKAQEEAASAKPETKPTEPAKKGLLDDLVVEPEKKTTPPADPYGDVKLRSDASPKTRETFEQLKTLAKQREEAARQEATAARTELEQIKAQVAELEKRTVPDEVQTELKELRAFRAQFDTANDPEFRQKYDTRIDSNYEAVYAKLAAHGLPPAEVAKLKSFSPGDRDTAIDNLISKLPPLERKFVEAKLLDNINVGDERERALADARTKADEILAKRKQEPAQQTQQRIEGIVAAVKPELAKLTWLHAKEIPATAAPEEKKRLEAENAAALELQESLKQAIVDDSVPGRARAALAVPLARHYSRAYVAEKARADALQKKLDDITRASTTSRTARSSASPTLATPAPKPTPTDPSDALDALLEQSLASGRR